MEHFVNALSPTTPVVSQHFLNGLLYIAAMLTAAFIFQVFWLAGVFAIWAMLNGIFPGYLPQLPLARWFKIPTGWEPSD